MRRSTLYNFHVNSVGKQMHAWLPAWIRDACDTNGVTRFLKIERLIIYGKREFVPRDQFLPLIVVYCSS